MATTSLIAILHSLPFAHITLFHSLLLSMQVVCGHHVLDCHPPLSSICSHHSLPLSSALFHSPPFAHTLFHSLPFAHITLFHSLLLSMQVLCGQHVLDRRSVSVRRDRRGIRACPRVPRGLPQPRSIPQACGLARAYRRVPLIASPKQGRQPSLSTETRPLLALSEC